MFCVCWSKKFKSYQALFVQKGIFPWASNSVFLFETFEKGVEGNDSVS